MTDRIHATPDPSCAGEALKFYPTYPRASAYPPDAPLVTIANGPGDPLVTIRRDGTVDYRPDADVTAAARVFWEAISASIPGPFRGCPDPDAHQEPPRG